MRPSTMQPTACATLVLAILVVRTTHAAHVSFGSLTSLSPDDDSSGVASSSNNAALTSTPSTPCDASFSSIFQCPPIRRPCRAPSAVLQRNTSTTIWGRTTCTAGSNLSVMIDGEHAADAVVGADGIWRSQLPPQPASWRRRLVLQAPIGSLAPLHGDTILVNFGEVLLCSGQSNMGIPVAAQDSELTTPSLSVKGFNPPMFIKNGSAELAAAGKYTDKIFLMHPSRLSTCGAVNTPSFHMGCAPTLAWQRVSPELPPNGALSVFSGLCWHTGKALFERLGGSVPVGLIEIDAGGSAIELWLPPGYVNSTLPHACGVDTPQCEGHENITDSFYYQVHINTIRPYTFGALIWDQGERDVHCILPATNHRDRYSCLQRSLIESWRSQTIGFDANFTFAAVQLPGYLGDCNHMGESPYEDCVPGVFDMRLAQDSLNDIPRAVAVPTYDLSCPYGVINKECPFGTVHNMDKAAIGERIAMQLLRLLPSSEPGVVAATDFPRGLVAESIVDLTAGVPLDGAKLHTVTIKFEGGRPPLQTVPTLNCIACCANTSAGDFDVSSNNGTTYVNATGIPTVISTDSDAPMSIRFQVWLPRGTDPTHVRYTANQPFPQCAIVDSQQLPVYPFKLAVGRPGRRATATDDTDDDELIVTGSS